MNLAQGMLLGVGEILLGQHLLEPADKPSGPSSMEHFQALGHEISGLWPLLVIKAERGFRQVFQHMKNVEDKESHGELRVRESPQ